MSIRDAKSKGYSSYQVVATLGKRFKLLSSKVDLKTLFNIFPNLFNFYIVKKRIYFSKVVLLQDYSTFTFIKILTFIPIKYIKLVLKINMIDRKFFRVIMEAF